MSRPSLSALCQGYLLLLMLAAAILSPLPYSVAALVLLLSALLAYGRRPAGARAAHALATLFILPLALEPALAYLPGTGPALRASVEVGPFAVTAAHAMAVVVALPVLYLVGRSLRELAGQVTPASRPGTGYRITTTAQALVVAAAAILVVAIVTGSTGLFLASLASFLYLVSALIVAFRAVPRPALEIPAVEKRLLAGTTAEVRLAPRGRRPAPLHCTFGSLEAWVKIGPARLTLDGEQTELTLTVVPPLAGLSRPRLRVCASDPRGLVRLDQTVEPVALQVIPRARYARWLAERFLEGTSAEGTAEVTPSEALVRRGRGIEYTDSRSYQPGDELRRVDWKHTIKLDRLTIKEFVEAGGQTAILAVNLTVGDADEADSLSYNAVTVALSLAEAAIPAALAAYDRRDVVAVTGATDPRETLKRALALTGNISVEDLGRRRLQSVDSANLRRSIARLAGATAQPTRRLRELLELEYRAVAEAAANNPATRALSQCIRHTPPPATIVLVSGLNHDSEAVAVTTERLSRRGFAVLPVTDGARSADAGRVELGR